MAIKQLEENNEEDEEMCCLYNTLKEQELINQHLFARMDLMSKRIDNNSQSIDCLGELIEKLLKKKKR